MSKYTTELRFICEQLSGLPSGSPINDIIVAARRKIFNFDYPLYSDAYKPVFETKILKHFYTQEIGLETFGLWQLKLDTLLNEIMPYYNQLYQSAEFKFNPLFDTDLTTDHKGTNDVSTTGKNKNTVKLNIQRAGKNIDETAYTDNGETTSKTTQEDSGTLNITENEKATRNNTTNTKNLYSDTPQGSLQNVEYETYLTNATINNAVSNGVDEINRTNNQENTGSSSVTGSVNSSNSSTNTSTTTIDETDTHTTKGNNTSTSEAKTTDEYVTRVYGKTGGNTYGAMLKDYREALINVDLMVMEELSILFMKVW